MLEIISETFLTRAAETVVSALARKLKIGESGNVNIDQQEIRATVAQHVRMVGRWAGEISFRELNGPKSLHQSFVDLDLHVGEKRALLERGTQTGIRVSDIITLPGNIVLLGDPGAGKTTSLKRIALGLLQTGSPGKFPLLVRLRDYPDTNDTIPELLLRTLGVTITFETAVKPQDRIAIASRAAVDILEQISAFVLVDGLDELNPAIRKQVMTDLRFLFLNLQKTRIILTCRTGDFVYQLENARVLMLNPLSGEQVEEFAIRWLGTQRAEDFLEKIRRNPYAGTEIRPLTLAHLCAIYERSGSVPDKPRAVYRKIVRLLLEEWDEQRMIQRHSRYADFTIDRKEDFLKAIAFQTTARFGRPTFEHRELEEVYRGIYEAFGLPAAESAKVMREVESHTGLVVEVAYDSYEFAHKSIQEYLAAEYLLKLPRLPEEMIGMYPNEAALVVTLSSDPADYFVLIVDILTAKRQPPSTQYTEPFLRRLLVEKVDLVMSFDLALAILGLFSKTYYDNSIQQHELFPPLDSAFFEFLGLPPVRGAIMELLRASKIRDGGGLTFRVRPPRWSRWLNTARRGSALRKLELTIDTRVLEAAGIDVDKDPNGEVRVRGALSDVSALLQPLPL
jgi:GTPase SAR1 family protein